MAKLILHYNHDSRTITQENGGAVSFEAARKLWDQCKLDDWNLALYTLANNDWDADKVEAYYRSLD